MAVLLLVDNDARIVELTAWFLDRLGHQVRTAVSYAAARAQIEAEGAPDLMLADLELGVESGREELPRLSRSGGLPPTLVVSGYLDADLRRELMALPEVYGTLAKPFDMPELEAAIADCLQRAQKTGGPPQAIPTTESASASTLKAAPAVLPGPEGSREHVSPAAESEAFDPLSERGTLQPQEPPSADSAERAWPARPTSPAPEPPKLTADLAAEEEDEEDGWIEILPGALPQPPSEGPRA